MAKFSSWNIPFASIPCKSREIELRTCWRDAARKKKANIHKQFVSTNAFIRDLVSAIQNRYPIPYLQTRSGCAIGPNFRPTNARLYRHHELLPAV